MKRNIINSLIIMLLLFFNTIANAQEKQPTKEETVKYINSIVSMSLGITEIQDNSERTTITCIGQSFSLDEVIVKENKRNNESGVYASLTERIYNIPWGYMKENITLQDVIDLVKVRISFERMYNVQRIYKDGSVTNNAFTSFSIYVLPDKAENVKKALLHLRTLRHEKDPFD